MARATGAKKSMLAHWRRHGLIKGSDWTVDGRHQVVYSRGGLTKLLRELKLDFERLNWSSAQEGVNHRGTEGTEPEADFEQKLTKGTKGSEPDGEGIEFGGAGAVGGVNGQTPAGFVDSGALGGRAGGIELGGRMGAGGVSVSGGGAFDPMGRGARGFGANVILSV